VSAVKVLLDTDIGSDIDDAICLSYLLCQPRCELVGVTTVSGQPHSRAALVDAVCRAAGRRDVPVHAGTEHAIGAPTPQPDVPHAAVLDRFGYRSPDEFMPNTAVTFMREAIESAPDEVTLLAIGPLTNVGLLFATYPDSARKLAGITIMGGAYSMSPWVGGGQEWNVYCDPVAADVVYRTPVRSHRSVGLNVTSPCVHTTRESLERFQTASGPWEVVAAIMEMCRNDSDTVTYHDPLAGALIFRPELCEWQHGRVSVELISERYRGATAFDPDPGVRAPHLVAAGVNPHAFFEELFGHLS
jgi:inosine-uridine nucleoside N-ribohydrolase